MYIRLCSASSPAPSIDRCVPYEGILFFSVQDVALTRYLDEASINRLQSVLSCNIQEVLRLLLRECPNPATCCSSSSPPLPNTSSSLSYPSHHHLGLSGAATLGGGLYHSSSSSSSSLTSSSLGSNPASSPSCCFGILKQRLREDFLAALFLRELLQNLSKLLQQQMLEKHSIFTQLKQHMILFELRAYLDGSSPAVKQWREVFLPLNQKAEQVKRKRREHITGFLFYFSFIPPSFFLLSFSLFLLNFFLSFLSYIDIYGYTDALPLSTSRSL